MPLNKEEQAALEHFVHTPAESAAGFIRFAKEIKEQPGITFGCILDKYIIPIRPGRVLSIIGRSGGGKSTLGAALISKEALRILKDGEETNKYAVHVSWEQPVEELEAWYQCAIPEVSRRFTSSDIAWGKIDIEALSHALSKRPRLPVWLFGDSLYNTNLQTPQMFIENIYHAVSAVWKEYNMRPSVMFLDFIQNIPVRDERERSLQVAKAMRMVKRLAVQVKCPVILGVQANQRVDEYQNPIPTMRDAEWSAAISQLTDVYISIWRPITTWPIDEKPTVEIKGVNYNNSPELMVVRLWKQRLELGSGTFVIHLDPATLRVADYEVREIHL